MTRPITIFTGQWADLPLTEMAQIAGEIGYDGLELACWGDHFDVDRGAVDKDYCQGRHDLLAKHGLRCFAISNHSAGQLVCDPNNDSRTDAYAPAALSGKAEEKRAWAVEAMKNSARAARNMGLKVVNGFTGSPIWHMFYPYPGVTKEMIDQGYRFFADMWNPILDVFDECGVRFALEVHPTEIAFDLYSAERALEAINHREAFGFNFDPSHFHWQFVDPVEFINAFPDRIYHAHMKDAIRNLDGKSGILSSHLSHGDYRRGWDFRSLGRGEVDFEAIIRALNRIDYQGPLSVEWEDSGMDRVHGAEESCDFLRALEFKPSEIRFDAAFERED